MKKETKNILIGTAIVGGGYLAYKLYNDKRSHSLRAAKVLAEKKAKTQAQYLKAKAKGWSSYYDYVKNRRIMLK